MLFGSLNLLPKMRGILMTQIRAKFRAENREPAKEQGGQKKRTERTGLNRREPLKNLGEFFQARPQRAEIASDFFWL